MLWILLRIPLRILTKLPERSACMCWHSFIWRLIRMMGIFIMNFMSGWKSRGFLLNQLVFNLSSWPLSPWERLGVMFVAECHDVDVLRQSAFPKNKRASAQNSAFASNTSLRPFNGKANYLRTSTHRAKIRIKHNTKSFSCRDRPMIMNSIDGCNLCV